MRPYRPCAWCGRPTVRAELVEAHLPPYGPWPAWLRAADWVVWLCPDCFGVPPAAPPLQPTRTEGGDRRCADQSRPSQPA